MNRSKLAALGLATTAVLTGIITLPIAPASAAKPAKPTPSPTSTPPVQYTESGCYDLIGGGPDYQKLLQSINTVTAPVGGAGGTYTDLKLGKEGLLEAGLLLAAPSCTDVTYELEAYDENDVSLGKASAPGDGTDSLLLDLVIRDRAALNVFVQVRTVAPTGQVVDRGAHSTGLDGSLEVIADADGTPDDNNGGNVTWR